MEDYYLNVYQNKLFNIYILLKNSLKSISHKRIVQIILEKFVQKFHRLGI